MKSWSRWCSEFSQKIDENRASGRIRTSSPTRTPAFLPLAAAVEVKYKVMGIIHILIISQETLYRHHISTQVVQQRYSVHCRAAAEPPRKAMRFSGERHGSVGQLSSKRVPMQPATLASCSSAAVSDPSSSSPKISPLSSRIQSYIRSSREARKQVRKHEEQPYAMDTRRSTCHIIRVDLTMIYKTSRNFRHLPDTQNLPVVEHVSRI